MVQKGECIAENGQILVRAHKLLKMILDKHFLGETKRKMYGFCIKMKQDVTEKSPFQVETEKVKT